MLPAILFCIAIGLGLSFQTAINARLRSILGMPFLTSFVSFTVGTLCLAAILLLQGIPLAPPATVLHTLPWWGWIGGALGMFALTGNILLFPKLGGVQTAVLPIAGQILTALLIDQFGFFGAPRHAFDLSHLLGILLVASGILCAVLLPALRNRATTAAIEHRTLPLWQLLGVGIGALLACQTAVNARLAAELHSTVHAAFISFVVGTAGLILAATLRERSLPRLKNTTAPGHPWWIWTGGALGATYVFGSAALVPLLGTGGVVVLFLLGLICGSLTVDRFGLFGAPRKPIFGIQILGLILLTIGVVIIQFARVV